MKLIGNLGWLCSQLWYPDNNLVSHSLSVRSQLDIKSEIMKEELDINSNKRTTLLEMNQKFSTIVDGLVAGVLIEW